MVKSVFKVVPGIRIRRGTKLSIPYTVALKVITELYGEVEAEQITSREEAQSILNRAFKQRECPFVFNVM